MPSSSWGSIDPKAVPIHLQRHKEALSISCSSNAIDPTPIEHSLWRPIQPVIHKLCEGMSIFGWIMKCQSISRNSGQTHNCFINQVVGINMYVAIECIDHKQSFTEELESCPSVWVSVSSHMTFKSNCAIFESFTCIFMWSSSAAW